MTIWVPDLAPRKGSLYKGIADAIGRDIASGRLPPGSRLPTHRELAERLGVTVGTVSRGYAEAARRGLLSGEVGRGTYTLPAESPARTLLADEAPSESVIDLSVNHPPSLSGERDRDLLRRTLREIAGHSEIETLMDYQPGGGAERHRQAGAEWVRRCGLEEATAERVLLCSGSQHATATLLATLMAPGDLVLTESLTHPGFRILANLLRLRLQGLAMDDSGVRPDALEAACRNANPRALYCLPTIHNPTAIVMPDARRREIAEIASSNGLAIVEDDIHGLLPDPPFRPISSYAPSNSYYITSTSKLLAPGLRIAYLLAPGRMVDRLAAGIRATTWMAPPLLAEIATRWIEDGTDTIILRRRREEAAARQAIAAERLGAERFRSHPNGYHLWLTLPEPWGTDAFAEQARRRGVAVTPAGAFLVGRTGAPPAVRVCLGPARDREALDRALSRLAGIFDSPPVAGPAIV